MATSSFLTELYKAYKTTLYTDLKITCGSAEFKVHKIILCSRSKVFRAMCSGSFVEATSNTINLTEDGINLVARLIDCLYLGTYGDFKVQHDAEYWKSAHQLHAAMFALGDKYDCAIVKEKSQSMFHDYANKDDEKNRLGLIASIPIVYSSTPDSERALRDVAVSKVKASPWLFLKEEVKPSYRKVLLEVPDFSWDLHQYWMAGGPR